MKSQKAQNQNDNYLKPDKIECIVENNNSTKNSVGSASIMTSRQRSLWKRVKRATLYKYRVRFMERIFFFFLLKLCFNFFKCYFRSHINNL